MFLLSEPRKKPERNRPEWQKGDDDILTDDEFDEHDFLRGRIPLLRQSVDRELPPRPGKVTTRLVGIYFVRINH